MKPDNDNMTDQTNAIKSVRLISEKKILFLPHAVRQMSRPDRMISTAEVRNVVRKVEIIEDYPENGRGHSSLILGYGDEGRPIHVVCSPKSEYLAIITAYIPNKNGWEDNCRKRKIS